MGRRRSPRIRRPHESRGHAVAANVERLLASGKASWYADDANAASGKTYFDLSLTTTKAVDAAQAFVRRRRQEIRAAS